MLLVVDALREAGDVEVVSSGEVDGAGAGEAARAGVEQVGVVELPPGALVAGALGGVGRELGGGAEDDEVAVLVAGESGADGFLDDQRLSLSRVGAATRSLEVGVLDDQHGRVGVADDVAGEGQALAVSEVDDAGGGAMLHNRRVAGGAVGSDGAGVVGRIGSAGGGERDDRQERNQSRHGDHGSSVLQRRRQACPPRSLRDISPRP